jgi:hypothetical protein
MNDTERYLKAATRGLWGRERNALTAELRGHISARIQDFRLGGLSGAEAERQTLRELGAPVQVSGGMLGVHTLPALGKAGALTALLMTGLLTVLPQGLAQVGSIFTAPHITIDGKGEVQIGASSYLDFEQLRKELAKAGAQLQGSVVDPTLVIPGAPRPTQSLGSMISGPGGSLTQDGRTYIMTNTLVNSLQNSGADISVSGWINPVLHANQTNIQIRTDDWRISSSLYLDTLQNSTELKAGNLLGALETNGDTSVLNIAGSLKAGKIYALITAGFGLGPWTVSVGDKVVDKGNIFLTASFDQAKAKKALFRIENEAKNHKFYSNVADFQKALDPYRDMKKTYYWDAQHPAPALLLELSGHFGKDAYTVVNPATVKGTITDH